MSKAVKRKITVELPKPRDLSKNRLSVFQRLGTKKPKSIVVSTFPFHEFMHFEFRNKKKKKN